MYLIKCSKDEEDPGSHPHACPSGEERPEAGQRVCPHDGPLWSRGNQWPVPAQANTDSLTGLARERCTWQNNALQFYKGHTQSLGVIE